MVENPHNWTLFLNQRKFGRWTVSGNGRRVHSSSAFKAKTYHHLRLGATSKHRKMHQHIDSYASLVSTVFVFSGALEWTGNQGLVSKGHLY